MQQSKNQQGKEVVVVEGRSQMSQLVQIAIFEAEKLCPSVGSHA